MRRQLEIKYQFEALHQFESMKLYLYFIKGQPSKSLNFSCSHPTPSSLQSPVVYIFRCGYPCGAGKFIGKPSKKSYKVKSLFLTLCQKSVFDTFQSCHHYQGSIYFNTVNIHLTVMMDVFLVCDLFVKKQFIGSIKIGK